MQNPKALISAEVAGFRRCGAEGLSPEAGKAEFEPHDLLPPDVTHQCDRFYPARVPTAWRKLEKVQPESAAEEEVETVAGTGIRLRLSYD
jgi:hypothetical protein